VNRELPKPLRWVGSTLRDLRAFPSEVRSAVGYALYAAQNGNVDPAAKPMKGFGGASVMEITAPFSGDTWRAIYTVRFQEVVYVLHAFQKKSKSGASTPKKEIDLIYQRLAAAQRDYETRQKLYADQKKNR
jgi:phage-related protein